MQAIRQIIETKILKSLINIPDDFSSETVEIIVFPLLPVDAEKTTSSRNSFLASAG